LQEVKAAGPKVADQDIKKLDESQGGFETVEQGCTGFVGEKGQIIYHNCPNFN
jgi:hypothetical protein